MIQHGHTPLIQAEHRSADDSGATRTAAATGPARVTGRPTGRWWPQEQIVKKQNMLPHPKQFS